MLLNYGMHKETEDHQVRKDQKNAEDDFMNWMLNRQLA